MNYASIHGEKILETGNEQNKKLKYPPLETSITEEFGCCSTKVQIFSESVIFFFKSHYIREKKL